MLAKMRESAVVFSVVIQLVRDALNWAWIVVRREAKREMKISRFMVNEETEIVM
jgi:hypothetical protein